MTSAIIVAAGSSSRMGQGADKLLLPIAGRPLVAHTWGLFDSCDAISEIVLVIRAGMQPVFSELATRYGFRKPFQVVPGGKERQDSVWNGLEHLDSKAQVVAIHDAARPCASEALINATIAAARDEGAAVAAQAVSDTIKQSDDGHYISRHLDRSRLCAVQTPQTFRVEIIRRALAHVREKQIQVTDDTAACEFIGQRVKLVFSAAPKPKVTHPGDVPCIELLLGAMRR